MRTPVVGIVCTLLASAAAPRALSQTVTPRAVAFPGVSAWVRLDTVGQAVTVWGSPPAIFAALRSAYAAARVPVTLDDSAGGMIGTLRPAHLSSLAGSSLSRALECGAGLSGPYADNARVDLVLVSMIAPAGADSTSLRTALVATARTMDGAARPTIICTTRGFIEGWIRTRVNARLVGP